MNDTYCIKCMKDISWDDEYCPYCKQRQFIDGTPSMFKPKKVKSKSKPLFSTAEVYTALNKSNDGGYLAFLATKLFGG